MNKEYWYICDLNIQISVWYSILYTPTDGKSLAYLS